MNTKYNKIYKELIINLSNGIIIDYDMQKKCKYKPFIHYVSSSALDDLKVATKYAFSQHLPTKTNPNYNGTIGEFLLKY